MTVLTDTQVVTASGGLVELGYSQITSSVTVSSASTGTAATSVISPLTVVCDGSPVLIEFSAVRVDSGASSNLTISLLKDGVEFSRTWGFINPGGTSVPVKLTFRDTPTAGSHTYEVRSWYGGANSGLVAAGSGTTSNSPAFLRVSKIVQATQWPAVTTGTIICTSSTRPASPFAGQQIYETDTSRNLFYSGTAWVAPAVFDRVPVCRLTKASTQNIPNAVDTLVTWDSAALVDTDSFYNSALSNGYVTVPRNGVYQVIINASWDSNTTGRRVIYATKNATGYGSGIITGGNETASVGSNITSASAIFPFITGDIIRMYVFQDSTATRTIGNLSQTDSLQVAWIGPS